MHEAKINIKIKIKVENKTLEHKSRKNNNKKLYTLMESEYSCLYHLNTLQDKKALC